MLRTAGVRPTQQRTALASYLFNGMHKHVTAEMIYAATRKGRSSVSLATVYNNLHQFAEAGLLREILVDQKFRYFDTNVTEHFHFFDEDTGRLSDVTDMNMRLKKLPPIPHGKRVMSVDVVIRLSKDN